MEFLNREKDVARLKAILSGEPNVIWFIYGPINSGKTALIMRVIEELPGDYCAFYINFRGKQVYEIHDLIRVLFKVKKSKEFISDEIKDIVKELLKLSTNAVQKLFFKSIPVPENIFDLLFRKKDKVEDIFDFLEEFFGEIRKNRKKPIFVLDELQTIKEIVNASGRPILSSLFNFLIRLTKETHLCHCLCATSDCLFMEDIYSNAQLEGRAEGLLVDDLNKKEAFKIYDSLHLKEKELIWEYVGGKIGDIIRLCERKKLGDEEKEIVEKMKRDAIQKLLWIKARLMKEKPEWENYWHYLKKLKESPEISFSPEETDFVTFWVKENVLFYDPASGIIKPQSRLIFNAIKELLN